MADSPVSGSGQAPDLFEALELEPMPASARAGSGRSGSPATPPPLGSAGSGVPDAVPEFIDEDDETTNPISTASPEAAAAPRTIDADDDPFVEAEPVPVAGRSVPWGWVAMTLVLAGSLGYVLYSETDLFQGGDPIARRDAQALAEAEYEQAVAQAEVDAKKKDYGSLQLNSTPEGARVWMLKPGPTAAFDNLPRAHEFQVLVDAPGHVPRIRTVKGSELSGPVVMDLDAAPDPDAVVPMPEAEPPKLADDFDPKDTVTLELKSNTEGAQLGLLVGFTPGMTMVDLDVGQTHHFRLTLPGHGPHDVVLKGRHWEEGPDGELVYLETVTLEPQADEEVMALEDEGEAKQAPPAPKPKKKRRKKKRRRRKK